MIQAENLSRYLAAVKEVTVEFEQRETLELLLPDRVERKAIACLLAGCVVDTAPATRHSAACMRCARTSGPFAPLLPAGVSGGRPG